MTVFRGDSSFVRKKRNIFMLYISDSREHSTWYE